MLLRERWSTFSVLAGFRYFGFSAFDLVAEFLFCCVVECPGFLFDLVGDLVLCQKLLCDLANLFYPHILALLFGFDLFRRYCHFVDCMCFR